MNQGWIYREQVPANAGGQTVLDYYSQRYRHSSRADWQVRIARGQIYLDDHPAAAEMPLKPGQHLAYYRLPWEEPPVPLDIQVLYDDGDVIAVAKPAGLPVLPAGGFLQHTLLYQLQQRYPTSPPVPVHRLGRGTSGLVLLARSAQARAQLSQQFRQQPSPLTKRYRALIGPSDLPDRFPLTQAIGKLPHPTLGYVYGASPKGRPAYSTAEVLRRTATTTLLAITLHTGRPHQIRIQLAAAGYPLLGDPLYLPGGQPRLTPEANSLPAPGDIGYHLHAHQLRCHHPSSHHWLELVCPPLPELT